METLANFESFVRSAERGSFSAAADAFLLAAGHCALVTTACPIFTSHRPRVPRARAASERLRIRFDEDFAETLPSISVRGEVRTTEVPFRTTDSGAQIVAVRQALGMTTLPCFVGNVAPLLMRVPRTDVRMYGTLWLPRRSACSSSQSSYPEGSLRTCHFLRTVLFLRLTSGDNQGAQIAAPDELRRDSCDVSRKPFG
jgi:hypothetical protein